MPIENCGKVKDLIGQINFDVFQEMEVEFNNPSFYSPGEQGPDYFVDIDRPNYPLRLKDGEILIVFLLLKILNERNGR